MPDAALADADGRQAAQPRGQFLRIEIVSVEAKCRGGLVQLSH